MEEFKNAIRVICIVSAAVCIIENLVSGTKLRNQIKLILNLILIMTIISPFIGGGFSFDLPDFNKYDNTDFTYSQEVYNEELIRQASENVSAVLFEQITAAGINCEKIETDVNIFDDGSIFISKVIINADDFDSAATIVRSSIGSNETEVINGNS